MSTHHFSRRLAALATAIHSVASAIQSIRSPGTEGHNQATHAIDILTQLQEELAGELSGGPASVENLQADPSTTVTTNPGTRESEVLAQDASPSAPADNKATPASVVENAAAQGVKVEPVKGSEGDKAAADGKPVEPKAEEKAADATPAIKLTDPAKNATGAVGIRTSSSGA